MVAFEPGLDFVRALYACIYAGMVVVPIPVLPSRGSSPSNPHLERIAADSGSALCMASRGHGEDLATEVWALSALDDVEHADAWVMPDIDAADPVILQYTSGSTADPKGVVITNANLLANQQAIAEVMELNSDSVICGWLPHYHDMGLIGLYLQSMYCGADLVAMGAMQFVRRPVLWLDLIARHRATVTVAPDFAYNLCAKLATDSQCADLDLASLRTAITGAEPVRAETLHRFTERFAASGFDPDAFVPAYGMAETTLLVTGRRKSSQLRVLGLDRNALASGIARAATAGPGIAAVVCGEAAPGHRVEIVDPDTGKAVAEGTIGEVWVAGPSVAPGYWQRPEATERAFGACLEGDVTRFVRTGDLGFLDDGELVVTGRSKDVVIVNGRNIYATDVEHALSEAVDASGGMVVAAFEWDDGAMVAVLEAGGSIDQKGLEEARGDVVRALGLDEMRCVVVPAGWVPRTTSGKVKRAAARQRLLDRGDLHLIAPTTWSPHVNDADRTGVVDPADGATKGLA